MKNIDLRYVLSYTHLKLVKLKVCLVMRLCVYTSGTENECLNMFHYKYMLCVIWSAPASDTVGTD